MRRFRIFVQRAGVFYLRQHLMTEWCFLRCAMKNYLRTNNFFSVFSNSQIATNSRKKVEYKDEDIIDNRRKNTSAFSIEFITLHFTFLNDFQHLFFSHIKHTKWNIFLDIFTIKTGPWFCHNQIQCFCVSLCLTMLVVGGIKTLKIIRGGQRLASKNGLESAKSQVL